MNYSNPFNWTEIRAKQKWIEILPKFMAILHKTKNENVI